MAEAGRRPSGVVTLLFTDVVGSTELLDQVGDDVAEEMRCRHFTLLRRALDDAGGSEVKNLGDGLMASFTSPRDALGCAVAMQRAVADANRWIRRRRFASASGSMPAKPSPTTASTSAVPWWWRSGSATGPIPDRSSPAIFSGSSSGDCRERSSLEG